MKLLKFKSCEEFINALQPGDFIVLENEKVLFVYMGNYKKSKWGWELNIFRIKCCYDDSLTFDNEWPIYDDVYETARIMRNK